MSIFREKKEIIYELQGCSWRDVLRKTLRFFALWWHFGCQCGQLCAFILNPSVRLQPMVLWPVRRNVIEKSTQWCQEWILSLPPCLVRPLHCLSLPVLNRADFVLMDRWGTLLHVTKNDIGSWCAFFVSCCQTAWPALSKQNQFW